MKTSHLPEKQKAAGPGSAPPASKSSVDDLTEAHPELSPVVEWMQANRCDPHGVVREKLAALISRGKFLPKEQRRSYAKRVLLSEFFYRWAQKHRGKSTVKELQDDAETNESEIRPVQFALMAVGDARTFMKTLPRLAKVKTVLGHGGDLGNADDFSCFVVNQAPVLAHRFLSNFDTDVKNASTKAVSYIAMTAVSHYLRSGAQVERDDAGIASHLRKSKRLVDRTKLATKLAYLPSALTDEERCVLREEYGVQGSLVKRMRIKDIARLLGYPSGRTLSRKLFRLKQWVKNYKVASAEEVTS